jgi:hypothetical protein
VVVHNHIIGVVSTPLGAMVPRKEKIQHYRSFFAIETAAADIGKLTSDFILQQEQMINDFAELQIRLNELWRKPIEDFRNLLLKELNHTLLMKYNLEILLPAGVKLNKTVSG